MIYQPDINDVSLLRAVNLPAAHWGPGQLACFKTENFSYTGARDLDKVRASIGTAAELGFSSQSSSHLVGVLDYTTPWMREYRTARGAGLESVVLFALDQYCLMGYEKPERRREGRSCFLG